MHVSYIPRRERLQCHRLTLASSSALLRQPRTNSRFTAITPPSPPITAVKQRLVDSLSFISHKEVSFRKGGVRWDATAPGGSRTGWE